MILNTLSSQDLLIDAYKFYSRRDARAHDALSIIMKRDDMTTAVKGCLDQAFKEEEQTKQQLYLQAACFGKKSYPGVALTEFPSACRLVRVMNILRHEGISTECVDDAVRLLISSRRFEPALWIVQYLQIGGEKMIRTKWCEYLVKQYRIPDDKVVEEVERILGPDPQLSYADIANKAIESSRLELAIKLLQKESQSIKQIPLLLNLKQYDQVLIHALSTCDSNLIYMAILKLRELIPNEITFLELLKKHKLAFKYFCNFLAATDTKMLIMISHKESPDDELIWTLIDKRYESALSVANKMRRDLISQQIDISIRLNKFQQSLTVGSPPLTDQSSWTGLSVSDTVINLIALGQSTKAKDAQRKFDVSEKKYKVLEQIANNTLPKLSIPLAQV